MTPELNSQISEFLDRYQPMSENAMERIRTAIVMSAEFIAAAKKPIDTVTETTLRLNKVSHESLARLVKAQSDMIEAAVEAAAKHLNTAADAKSWKELVDAQVSLVPSERERIAKDARRTLEVFTDVREDVKDIFQIGPDRVAEAKKTVRATTTRARKTARKTTATARKKATATKRRVQSAARKTSGRKTTARKATARKPATRRTRKAA